MRKWIWAQVKGRFFALALIFLIFGLYQGYKVFVSIASPRTLRSKQSKIADTELRIKELAVFSSVLNISGSYFICANGEIKRCTFAVFLFKPFIYSGFSIHMWLYSSK